MMMRATHLNELDLNMIVAMDAAGGIGYKGKLPWPKNDEDMKFFQTTTDNSVVVMGRNTFEEIEEINNNRHTPCPTLLSNRQCIVISSKNINSTSEIFVEKHLENIVKYNFEEGKRVFVIGGLDLYISTLPWINTIYATVFESLYTCDKYLPLRYIMDHFEIVEGKYSNQTYFLKLVRKMGSYV